jgi:hypothetical protein
MVARGAAVGRESSTLKQVHMAWCHPIKESAWLGPFAALTLIVLALLRPPPRSSAPAESRIVSDAAGIKVPVAVPFRGSVLTWCAFGAGSYLETTHSPETLFDAGSPVDRERFAKSSIGWFFPEVLSKDSLWTGRLTDQDGGLRNHYGVVEKLLDAGAGAYLGDCNLFGAVPLMRSVGLPAFHIMWHEENWDESLFAMARVETAIIDKPERGEALIESYKRRFGDLARELQPESLTSLPRILILGSWPQSSRGLYVKNGRNAYRIYLPSAGVANAADTSVRQNPDVERVLALEPDIIFLMGYAQTPQEFERDPRWRGMKAVQNRRIYRMPGAPSGGGGLAGLHFQPLWTRWMAELAHPDRMQPKLRELIGDYIVEDFGYRLSEDQIDQMLQIRVNKDQPEYTRFTRSGQTASTYGVSR